MAYKTKSGLQSSTAKPVLKLDLYDKKIIWYLSQNSRMQRSELAKTLGISLPRLHYKIERLVAELIAPGPVLNYPLLEMPSYVIVSEQFSEEARDKLLQTSMCWFFQQAIGKYQYIMIVITDDVVDFCTKYLADYRIEVHPIIRYIPDNYNPWHLRLPVLPVHKDRAILLDAKDNLILEHLCHHTLDSSLQIGQATGIDRKTVKSRIERMLAANVIQKFRYGINVFRSGFLVYMLKIDISPNGKTAIFHHLRSDDYAGFIFETLTGYVMYYMPPSHTELFVFTESIRKKVSNVQIDVIQTTDIFQVNLAPESVVSILKKRASAQLEKKTA